MTISGAGFTPGAVVRITLDASGKGTIAAGPDGSFVLPTTAPLSASRIGQPPRIATYAATDDVNTAQVMAAVIRPGAVPPESGVTRDKTTFAMGGFEPGATIYAHLRWNERWRRTIKLGIARGPCGSLTSTRKLFRKLGTRRGRNIYLQFDQNRRPSTTSHQTAVLRYRVTSGVAHDPESYLRLYDGWRERTGL